MKCAGSLSPVLLTASMAVASTSFGQMAEPRTVELSPVVGFGRVLDPAAAMSAGDYLEGAQDDPCPLAEPSGLEGVDLCLIDGRFAVAVYVVSESERRATPMDLDWSGADSGALFTFYASENPEVLLKVLDGCALNGHWWVFSAAATDRKHVVYVWDLHDANDGFAHGVGWESDGLGNVRGTNGFYSSSGVLNDVEAFSCNTGTPSD